MGSIGLVTCMIKLQSLFFQASFLFFCSNSLHQNWKCCKAWKSITLIYIFHFPTHTHSHVDVVCVQRSAFLSPQHASSIQHYHHLINAKQKNLPLQTHILFVHLVQYLNIGFWAMWFGFFFVSISFRH